MRRFVHLFLVVSAAWVSSACAEGLAANPPADLVSLYREALVANPTIAHARARFDGAKAREDAATARLFPEISASGNLTRGRRDDREEVLGYGGRSYGIAVNQPIYAPALAAARDSASFSASRLEAELESVAEKAIIDLAEHYFAILAAEDEVRRVSAEREAASRNLQRIDALYRRQLARITDLLEFSGRVDALEVKLLDAQDEVEEQRARLSERLGRAVGEPLRRVRLHLDSGFGAMDRRHWEDAALSANVELQARRLAVDAARAVVEEVRSRHHPSLNLQMSAQRSNIGYESAGVPDSTTYVVGLSLRMPLYSGGEVSASVRAAQSEADALAHELELNRRRISREVRRAHSRVLSANARIEAADRAYQSSTKAREAAENAFERGVARATDVIDANSALARADRDRFTSRYDYVLDMLRLRALAGALTEEGLVEIGRAILESGLSSPRVN